LNFFVGKGLENGGGKVAKRGDFRAYLLSFQHGMENMFQQFNSR